MPRKAKRLERQITAGRRQSAPSGIREIPCHTIQLAKRVTGMEVDDQTEVRRLDPADRDVPVVGRGEPFEVFVRREGNRLVGLAYVLCGSRASADDLVQEALLAAYRNWDEVGLLENPGAWVRKVLANQAVSLFRRRTAELKALGRLGTDRPRIEVPALSSDTEWIWQNVRRLPRRQIQVIALRYYDQLSLSEIAEVLGCSKETVNTHLRRAREKLGRLLDLSGERS